MPVCIAEIPERALELSQKRFEAVPEVPEVADPVGEVGVGAVAAGAGPAEVGNTRFMEHPNR
jgi:hypothetical protein